jgi:hypothetical protein
MKNFSEMSIEDRLSNVENFIHSFFVSFGVFFFLYTQITYFKNSIIWITLILAALLGVALGNTLRSMILISFFVGEKWEIGLRGFYVKYKKVIDIITIWISIIFVIVIISKFLNIYYGYSIGTIVLGILANFIYDKFCKKH